MPDNGTQMELTLRRMREGGYLVSLPSHSSLDPFTFSATSIDEALEYMRAQMLPIGPEHSKSEQPVKAPPHIHVTELVGRVDCYREIKRKCDQCCWPDEPFYVVPMTDTPDGVTITEATVEAALDELYSPKWRNAPGPNLLRAQMRAALQAALSATISPDDPPAP